MYEHLFCTLAYPVVCFVLSYVVSSFAMITYLVGVDEVVGVEAPLANEKLSVRVIEGLKEF